MKVIPAFLLFLLFFTGIAEAGSSIVLTPEKGHSNQDQINEALKEGNVYLKPGVYEIDGPLRIGSNTVLTGSKDAIIRVSPSSSQWFTGATGIINPSEYPLKNVEIYGFQIDGNLDELPRSYANYGTGDHNAERLIYLQGNKKTFMENISVHDMALYDSYSDGIQIAYANNVRCYNNFVSNCQHSGIFLVSVVGANVFKNDIAGICSDCLRLDNCMNTKIFDNVIYSYTGGNLNGQGTNGENGLQIADEGYSHGGGSAKPTHTTNIEVFNNVFANTGLRTVWLDSTGKGVTNVYIHDNNFLDGGVVETKGFAVNNVPEIGDLQYKPFPSRPSGINRDVKEPDIYNVMMWGISFMMVELDMGASATINYNNISYDPHSLIEVNGDGLDLIKYEYGGNTTRYFIEKGIWTGDLPHIGNELYIPGPLNADSLKITVYSEDGYQKVTDIKIIERKLTGATSINPDLFIFLAILAILGISISRNLRRVFP